MLDFGLASAHEISQELCCRLRMQRLAKRLKQVDLAQRAGISVVTLQRLETGKGGTLENFLRVVMGLNLVDELPELFRLQVRSIAQMEQQAAQKTYRRAPRQNAPSTKTKR